MTRCILVSMSMSSSGSFALKVSAVGSGHNRKPRKKRHRNKLRNSSLRKKRTKKFYSIKKTNSFKSNSCKVNQNTDKIMSNWYWSNYKKAVEWQDRHKIAHWKACALALLEENRYLLQIINDMRPGMVPDVSVTQSNLGEHSNFSRNVNSSGSFTNCSVSGVNVNDDGNDDEEDDDDDDDVDDDDDDDDDGDDDDGVDKDEDDINNEDNEDIGDECDGDNDIEFEMSEEMMQFFEQSYKHKMDLKKLKEKELLIKAEEEVKQMQINKIKRSTEMNLLYGDGASMIIGMETAVQLSFDKYCDTKSPKYWPNIPFRL